MILYDLNIVDWSSGVSIFCFLLFPWKCMKHVWSCNFAYFLSSNARFEGIREFSTSKYLIAFSRIWFAQKLSTIDHQWPWFCSKNCASKQMLTMQQVRPGHFDHLNSSGWSDHAQFASWRDLAAGYFDELALAVFDALVLVEQKQCKFGRMLLPHTDWMLRTVACRPLWAPRRKSFIFK